MFGKTLEGAEIHQGILFTIHKEDSIYNEFRFYSLSAVCQHREVRESIFYIFMLVLKTSFFIRRKELLLFCG